MVSSLVRSLACGQVRAVLDKHREKLVEQFLKWSGTDGSLGGGADTMSLQELMLALKTSKLFCEKYNAPPTEAGTLDTLVLVGSAVLTGARRARSRPSS